VPWADGGGTALERAFAHPTVRAKRLQKGKFVANAKPASLRSQGWFDNLDKIDMVAFHSTVHRRS
jgi:hypothetical protein